MVSHHILPIFIVSGKYLFGFLDHELYDYILSILFMSEITTLPLNICWYLNKQGNTNYMLYKISAFSLIISYIPFRIVNNTFVLFYIIYLNQYQYLIPQIILTYLNYNWFYKLLKKYKQE